MDELETTEEEVDFDEEEEVTFEEEIDVADFPNIPPVPEYIFNPWLLALPILCVLLLAWNVRWRGEGSPRGTRKSRKKKQNKG